MIKIYGKKCVRAAILNKSPLKEIYFDNKVWKDYQKADK